MKLTDTFTFRLADEDRTMLAEVAKDLGRSKGDAIRFLVRTTARLQREQAQAEPAGGDAR